MSTPVAEVQRDPALNAEHQHHHPHVHHANKSNDDVAYTVGTTPDSAPPIQFEKDAIPSSSDLERGSRSSNEGAVVTEKPRRNFSHFYRKYKIFFHVFWFVLFTG